MKRKLPDIWKVCPDCGYGLWIHRYLGTRVKGEHRLLNMRTKQYCRAVVVQDPLTRKTTVVSRVDRGVKHVPVGKRRDKRGQSKPR